MCTIYINTKNGAEAPIFKIIFQLLLSIHEVAKDKFFNAVADGIHTARPFKVIGDFEFFRNIFNFGVLPDHQVVRLLRIPIHVSA